MLQLAALHELWSALALAFAFAFAELKLVVRVEVGLQFQLEKAAEQKGWLMNDHERLKGL